MLKTRLIPILLLKNGRMVKGVRFNSFRDVGHPVTTAKIYDAQMADELVFLDIEASRENRKSLFKMVEEVADYCFMPLTVGGGIRTLEDIHQLLLCGADKVAINTAAVENPLLIREGASRFGRQCIVISIDAMTNPDGAYEVYTHAGHKAAGLDAVEWARQAVELGAGELLVTSIDREGGRQGYDLNLIKTISDSVSVPVIANGGVGTLQHLVDGVKQAHASAVAASSLFHFTDQSPIKARRYMKEAGLNVRLG